MMMKKALPLACALLGLAGAVGRVLRDADWARELGSRAMHSIGVGYGIPSMIQAIEALYRDAAENHA